MERGSRSLGEKPKRLARALVILGIRGAVALAGPAVRGFCRNADCHVARCTDRRVALIRLDLLGDLVFTLPAAQLIKRRWPDSRVTLVTLPQIAGLAALSPDVDEVISVDTNVVRTIGGLLSLRTLKALASAVRDLRCGKFDITISVYGLTASLVALCTRSSKRSGYRDEAYAGSLDDGIAGGRVGGTRRQHDWRFTEELVTHAMGENVDGEGAFPRIEVSRDARISADRLLGSFGLGDGTKLVVLHAGSRYGEFKRWPARSYVQLAQTLRSAGCDVVLVGAGSDAALADEIAVESGAVCVAGRTSLAELCAILDRAELVVSGDSGPLHLAAALGTKVIGVYGPTDPEVNGPRSWRGQDVQVLRRDIVCSPCYSVRVRAECPLGDPVCMRLVTADAVIAAACRMLGLTSPAGAVEGPA